MAGADNPFSGTVVSAPMIIPAQGFVTIPSSASAQLTTPVRGLIVTTTGNLGVKLANGSNNNSQLWHVTTGNGIIWMAAVQLTASNTAVVLGIV